MISLAGNLAEGDEAENIFTHLEMMEVEFRK
jgi:hypothetical protein